jgi:glycine betaine catabolism A
VPQNEYSEQRLTLPRRYYTDPDYFRDELDWLFMQNWICAGRVDQIAGPGDYFLRELGAESILIVRDSNGAIHAFFNVCRHRGTRICEKPQGILPGRIQCGYHGWTYGLDGKLLGAPHMDHVGFCREQYPLIPVSCEVWDGHIFVNIGENANPLASHLGDLPGKFAPWTMQDLRLFHRKTYEVECNWKLIVINYNECLHCPILHPLLNKMTQYLSGENDTSLNAYIGGSMDLRPGVETMSVDGKRRRACLPRLAESDRLKIHYYTIYPNLFLSLHPDYVMTHTLWPRAVDRTAVICEWHFHRDALCRPDFTADDVIEFWDLTNLEDWHICEMSHLGIRSRVYRPSPYSGREDLPYSFDRFILEAERRKNAAAASPSDED